MAFVYTEHVESGKVFNSRDGKVAIQVFHVKDDDPANEGKMIDTEAIAEDTGIYSLGKAHPSLPGLVLKDWEITPAPALNLAILTYNYARRDRGGNQGGSISTPNENGEIWTFNMMSQSVNINMVKVDENGKPQQVTYDAQTPKGEQRYSAINFNEDDGTVEGVSVYRPTEALNVTKVYDDISDVNQKYRETIRSLQNTLNDSQWPDNSEYNAGELLFLGADISYNIEEDTATVNYSFLAGARKRNEKFQVWSKDPQNPDDTTTVTIPKLYPFQVVWAPPARALFDAEDEVTPESKGRTNIKSVNVADVYEYGDFSQLKLIGD